MTQPGFFERLALAFKVIGNAELAARVRDALVTTTPAIAPTPAAPALPEKAVEKVVEERIVERVKVDPEAGALHVLSILQRDGRLVDFLQEDIVGASDADVGAAARIVHRGCRKALQEYIKLEPIRKEGEGTPITVEKGFDPAEIRLSGNVSGEPPFKGKLAHGGWRAVEVKLPDRPASVDAKVIAPAEVEL